jgi:YidC/Oxa1 family membrane protein insertase
MDRQATFGFVIIFVLLMLWMYMNSPKPKPGDQQTPQAQQGQVQKESAKSVPVKPVEQKPAKTPGSFGQYFAARSAGSDRFLTIETDLFTAQVSSKGGLITRWELKKYKTWDGYPVQLVDYEKKGDFSLLFTTSDGRLIDTRDLYFDVSSPAGTITLSGSEEVTLILTLPASNGGQIIKRLRFRNGEYDLKADIELKNMGDVVSNFEYQVVWENGLRYAEENSVDESTFAGAYLYAGKELTEIDATKADETVQKDMTGLVDWVGARTKYFALAFIPDKGTTTDGAYLEGRRKAMPDNGVYESYSVALKMPFKEGTDEKKSLTVFLGPMDHTILKSYDVGLENMLSLGWAFLVRPISEYIMLPVFGFLHLIIPNWGLVIIVFSIIIKIVLHPLTKSSMKSMKKMQALQPLMEEIKVKYKDDPQKMNSSVMNLYKEYGVNPAGGCLPMLLQLPILYALYMVFRSAIQLRQASFVWWIHDLSIPDVIYSLPFHLPVFGVKDISGLAVFMGVTMFVQQKMSVKDPRQKMMIWMMPIMWVLLFMSFPSGLNLYYTTFNILAIAQQMIINRQAGDEPLRKVEPKKKRQGGIFRNIPSDLTKFAKKR